MKLANFYSDGELSSIRVASTEDTVFEVKNLFSNEIFAENQIISRIKNDTSAVCSEVDELRLDFNRIYSKKSITKKIRFGRFRHEKSANYTGEFSIQTILSIKAEQRYLSAQFKGYTILRSRFQLGNHRAEPYLFATLKNGHSYLLNADKVVTTHPVIFIFKSSFNWLSKKIFSKTFIK